MRGKLITIVACVSITLFSIGCQKAYKGAPPDLAIQNQGAPSINYTLIYIVHGDGSYLYHDAQGKSHQADEETVAEAIAVAEHALTAEVFIFHLKPKKKLLFLIPLKDSEFYYYRNGRRLAKKSYSRSDSHLTFEKEAQYFHIYSAQIILPRDSTDIKTMFLYFGHEIPEFTTETYNQSYPGKPFTIHNLANGMNRFLNEIPGSNNIFDLTVLSTCYNGTPGVISLLSPYTRYVIASPDNLHLSYINTNALAGLDTLKNLSTDSLANRLASRAFQKLEETTQTTITISVYNIEKATPFLNSVAEEYQHSTQMLESENRLNLERFDCFDDSFYWGSGDTGVKVYYRPPLFGPQKRKSRHSGWGCWRKKEAKNKISLRN